LTSLVTSNVEPLRNDPYGEIKSVSIDLEGPVASGPDVMTLFEKVAAERVLFLTFNIDAKNKFRAARMRPETWEQLHGITDWRYVVCLAWYTYETRYRGQNIGLMDGLLLRRLRGESTYVRIGTVTWMPWELFDRFAAEAVVTVV
jgi:hypothetical protein